MTDVWQQRFPRFFAGERRLAAAISSTFRCCQTSVNSVFLNTNNQNIASKTRRIVVVPCASFVRGGPNLITFLVDEGIEDPNTDINGSSSARQRNTIHWRAYDGPTLNAGLLAL